MSVGSKELVVDREALHQLARGVLGHPEGTVNHLRIAKLAEEIKDATAEKVGGMVRIVLRE